MIESSKVGLTAGGVRSAARLTAPRSRGVGEDRVDLPWRRVGVVDPDLVLERVAAVDLVLNGGLETRSGKAAGGSAHLGSRLDLDSEMVEGPALVVLHQDELERGLGDGEVGVARPPFRGRHRKELGVELDRSVEVGNVDGELHPGHRRSSFALHTLMKVDTIATISKFVNVRDKTPGHEGTK